MASQEKYFQYILYGLIALGLLFMLYLFFAKGLSLGSSPISPSAGPSPGLSSKPKISITLIEPPPCRPCVDLREFADSIKNAGDVEVVEDETLSFEESQELIAKYNIKK